ncbi:hypothetical protein [Nitrospira sp. Kam-Ns4a]
MALDRDGFDRAVPLPPQLQISHIRHSIDYIEEQTSAFVDVYFEQANVFSALVGIFGVRALHSLSPYKKHKHPDVAQQRFPDLSLGGKLNPPPQQALESKGTTRPWALQSHYNHAGWYIVWRYTIDATRRIKGRELVIWRVDVCFLRETDWKYETSKATEGKGGRTHTFGVREPSRTFAGAIVYRHPKIALEGGRPVLANGDR